MIHIVLFGGVKPVGFRITGHSGYSDEGSDIVCAAVSSAAYMTANTVTDVLGLSPELRVDDGDMLLRLKTMTDADRAGDILNGFCLHIKELREQYPEFIDLTTTEV